MLAGFQVGAYSTAFQELGGSSKPKGGGGRHHRKNWVSYLEDEAHEAPAKKEKPAVQAKRPNTYQVPEFQAPPLEPISFADWLRVEELKRNVADVQAAQQISARQVLANKELERQREEDEFLRMVMEIV